MKRGSLSSLLGKNLIWKKGKREQYHLPYNIEAVQKNIKGVKGKRTDILSRKSRFKMEAGKNIKLYGTLYTPVLVLIEIYLRLPTCLPLV